MPEPSTRTTAHTKATEKQDEGESTSLDIAKIQQFVLALERTLRSFRLYTANNPILSRHRDDLFSRLTQILIDLPELRLTIQPFELRVGEDPVYENSNQQESFAFRLFNDGVRSLTFRAGLEEQELAEFLSALSLPPANASGDTDAIALLWEREFDHIRYTVADTLIDEPTSDDKSTQEKIDEIVDPKMAMYHGVANEPDEDLYQDLKITLNMVSVGQMFQQKCVVSPDELAKVQAEIAACDDPQRLVLDFVDMVLAVLQEETDQAEYDKVLGTLGSILDNNLMHGRIPTARMLMEQVHQFPARPIELSKADPQLLGRSLKILWPQTRIDLLVQTLNQEPQGTGEDIETLISLLDPLCLPYLLKQVPNVIDPVRRKFACKGIARLHRGDLGIFLPMLSSKDPDTLRGGLQIVSEIRSDRVVDLLPPLIQHPDLLVRKEAIAVLRNFNTPKALRVLVSLLRDTNTEIRVLALRILAGSRDREIARQLMVVINREDFIQLQIQERKSYYYAVAKIMGDDFVPYLQGILATNSWFRKPEMEESYQCAALALTVIATSSAKEVLTKAGASKNKSVKRLAEAALRAMAKAAPQS